MHPKTRSIFIFAIVIHVVLVMISCKKASFLNEPPDKQLIIPKTLSNFQAILDDYYNLNTGIPNLSELSSDNYYWLPGYLNGTLPEVEKIYTWSDDIWYNSTILNWNYPYNVIFNSNVVLEGLEDLKLTEIDELKFNSVKGTALFMRSFYFFQILQLFSPTYSEDEDVADLGIPLRLKSDINEDIFRSPLKESYDKVLVDLKGASSLLPNQQDIITRPTKSSSDALIARVYLIMNKYDSSLKYANRCLDIHGDLMDYNSVDVIPQFNIEVLWPGIMQEANFPSFPYASTAVDSNLIAEYSENDLRKHIFYDINPLGGYYFKGSYDGTSNMFAGIATDEIYLIKAECLARLNFVLDAMDVLNTLMEKRWNNNGTWVPYAANSKEEALELILSERRKELVFRGLRWSDIKRLNLNGANINLTRILDSGQLYELRPNVFRFTFLIPPSVIGFNSEMPQNPR